MNEIKVNPEIMENLAAKFHMHRGAKKLIAFTLFKQGVPVEEVACRLSLAGSTCYGYYREYLSRSKPLSWR